MAKEKILVTAATGTTGKRTVEHLRKHGRDVRALVHRENDASEYLKSIGAEVLVGDLLDFHGVRLAVEDVGPAYFCFPLHPSAIEAAALFAQAAVESGLTSIVNMSQVCARRESESHGAFNHWIGERTLDRSGIATTHIRPTLFAEWFTVYPGHLAEINSGLLKFPFAADAKHAPITGEDQARVIAAILEDPKQHAGKTYELFGLEEHTHGELVSIISEAVGRKVEYQPLSEDQARELYDKWYPPFLAQHLAAISKDYNNGIFSGTNDTVESITGEKPMSFDAFIRDNIALFETA